MFLGCCFKGEKNDDSRRKTSKRRCRQGQISRGHAGKDCVWADHADILIYKWCTTHKKGPYEVCRKHRPRSTCANAQVDLSRHFLLTESMNTVVYVDEQRPPRSDCADAPTHLDLRCSHHGIRALFPRCTSNAIGSHDSIFHLYQRQIDNFRLVQPVPVQPVPATCYLPPIVYTHGRRQSRVCHCCGSTL